MSGSPVKQKTPAETISLRHQGAMNMRADAPTFMPCMGEERKMMKHVGFDGFGCTFVCRYVVLSSG